MAEELSKDRVCLIPDPTDAVLRNLQPSQAFPHPCGPGHPPGTWGPAGGLRRGASGGDWSC